MTKILIDQGLASYGKMSGIGYTIVNLTSHLKNISNCDVSKYEFLSKIPRYFRKWAYIWICNIPTIYSNYELIHHLANYVPFIKGNNKHIMTIYDLSVFHYPETISLAWRHYNAFSLKKSIERSDALIVISKSVQNEVFSAFPSYNKSRVFVCYPGLRPSILNSKPEKDDVISLGVNPFSYFLFVGDLTKRKNLEFTLRAFLRAKQLKLLDVKTEFIIIGKKAWGYSEIKDLMNENSSVKPLGYLDDHLVTSLYKYAKAFVYPSLYEGFGIPIIEAMSQGAPIIISNIPASLELNQAHNNQMFCFELGNQEELVRLFQQLDKEFQSIRSHLNYGVLSKYYNDNLAARHLEIYSYILNGI